MRAFADRTKTLQESIFTTISNRAREAKAVNLGQGFPDFDGPTWLSDIAKSALSDEHALYNQYASAIGAPVLRDAIAKQQAEDWQTPFNSDSEITVTVGATEAIYATLQTLVNAGDEVVVFEPIYDSYGATIDMIGATPVPVTLRAPDFTFDENELRQAFSKKTKAVMINSPHNPTGKIFKREELELIGKLALEFDAWIITDEVYEHLTYDLSHKEFAQWRSSPEIRERCVAISSAGKTFGMTGWKIGWTMAPADISQKLRLVHQFIPFCATHPLQIAVAHGLNHRTAYLTEFKETYLSKRNLLADGMKDLGYDVLKSEGTYFLQLQVKEKAFDFCNRILEQHRVAFLPTTPFYLKAKDQGDHLVRLCFAKKDETLREALKRLGNHNPA